MAFYFSVLFHGLWSQLLNWFRTLGEWVLGPFFYFVFLVFVLCGFGFMLFNMLLASGFLASLSAGVVV